MSLTAPSLASATPIGAHAAKEAVPSGVRSASFTSVLDGAIQAIEAPRQEANQAIQNLLNGDEELHTVALATQRADLTFDLGLQVRNKVVSAYQEIMRMQV